MKQKINKKVFLFVILCLAIFLPLFLSVKPIKAADGVMGHWRRLNGNISPATPNDTLTINTSKAPALKLIQNGAFDAFQITGTGVRPVVVNRYGNLGVGTATPDTRLHVIGKTCVEGSDSGLTGLCNRQYSLVVGPEPGGFPAMGVYGTIEFIRPDTGTNPFDESGRASGVIGDINNTGELYVGTRKNLSLNSDKSILMSSPRIDITSNLYVNKSLYVHNGSGFVGIGTLTPYHRLTVEYSHDHDAVSRFFNSDSGTGADGITIELGNTSSAISTSNDFIKFQTKGVQNAGSIKGNGAKGVQYSAGGPADFAEYLNKREGEKIEFGSTVCIGEDGNAKLCEPSTANSFVGIASENPTFVGGNNLGDKTVAVALIGQVSVRVSTKEGEIKPGDQLALSETPGVLVKATKKGRVLGVALQAYSGNETGKIKMLLNQAYRE
jgi:hypothetical protein